MGQRNELGSKGDAKDGEKKVGVQIGVSGSKLAL